MYLPLLVLNSPPGLPPATAAALNQAIGEALRSPELVAKFDLQAGIPEPSSGGEYATYLRSELARWQPVIRKGNIKLE